jgi:predicted Zn-ribbon and HTH transcriptional regulator
VIAALFKCNNCGLKQTGNVKPELFDKNIKCPKCGSLDGILSAISGSKNIIAPEEISKKQEQLTVSAFFKCETCGFEKNGNVEAGRIGSREKCPKCNSFGNIFRTAQNTTKYPEVIPSEEQEAQTQNSSAISSPGSQSEDTQNEKSSEEIESGSFYSRNLAPESGESEQITLREEESPKLTPLIVHKNEVALEAEVPERKIKPKKIIDVQRSNQGFVETTGSGEKLIMKYESLAKRYYNQDPRKMFGFFPFNSRNGGTWLSPFLRLAEMAKNEDWDFQRPEFKKADNTLPILVNYLNYTFLRLQQQRKVSFIDDKACFNTGLQTPDEKDIFAIFSKNRNALQSSRVPDWYFDGWFDSYHSRLSQFRPLPEIASYIEDASDLVFDLSYEIDVNIGHILDDPDNQERLPISLRNERTLAMSAIRGATEFLKQKCIRNYKTAIPFWYPSKSKIQLMLPLSLTNADHADLALVADKDDNGKMYRIKTALTIDMAYNNARLITRPDREWLNP